MKIVKYILVSSLFIAAIVFSGDVRAELVAAPPGMEWLGMILQFLLGVPKVGAILVKLLEIMSIVSVGMTALAAAFQAFIKGSEGIAKLAGASEKAKMIAEKGDKVLYWIKYFSMFNAKK